MKIKPGIELLAETVGSGPVAGKAHRVVYNVRLVLNRGDEVPMNAVQIAAGVPPERVRNTAAGPLVDHHIVLGNRQCIPGIEQTLLGMRTGGFRKVRIAPHLAYGDAGVSGLVPGNALLVAEVWLRCVASGPDRCAPAG